MELPFHPALCTECVSCPLKFRSNFADRDSVIIGSLARHVWDFDLSLEFCLHYRKGTLKQTSLFCTSPQTTNVLRERHSILRTF